MKSSSSDYFARDYFEARDRFIERASERGAQLGRHTIAARGPNGAALSIDVAHLGAARPRRLLIVCSGTHGAEGFAGSAIQQRWLAGVESTALPSDTACLMVHAVNPYGFAWLRRTNENNVDLNRNALERFPGPANPEYRRLNHWLNPASGPSWPDLFWIEALWFLARMGFASVKQAIAGGQYEFPQGIFYGGDRLQESVAYLRDILGAPEFADVERVIALDIHTGLGRYGYYKLLVDFVEGSSPYQRLEQRYGAGEINGNRPEGSIAYRVSGGLIGLIERCFPKAQVYPAVLEFGTVPLVTMIARLRRENRAYFHADANSPAYISASAALMRGFCPTDTVWRDAIVERGMRVLTQSQRALADA